MVRAFVAAVCAVPLMSGAAFAGTAIRVPEPASLALLAVGAGALAAIRLRRRK
jgi:hypothetical protein